MRGMMRLAALAAALALAVPASSAMAASMACKKHGGKGHGWTLEIAKFQAFEYIQQVSGNWPFQTEQIKIISEKCQPEPGGYVCVTWANVCPNG